MLSSVSQMCVEILCKVRIRVLSCSQKVEAISSFCASVADIEADGFFRWNIHSEISFWSAVCIRTILHFKLDYMIPRIGSIERNPGRFQRSLRDAQGRLRACNDFELPLLLRYAVYDYVILHAWGDVS